MVINYFIWGVSNLCLENLAISTLLQPPILRTGILPHISGPSAQKPPSTKDITPVTLTNIPHVEATIFRPYLDQAGLLYDAFRRARESSEDVGAQSIKKIPRGSHNAPGEDSERRQPGVPASPVPLTFASPIEAPQPKRRTSGGGSRRAGLPVTPLSTIPSVYFEENFHLENPRTFDIVSERAEIVRPPPGANGSAVAVSLSGKKTLATNAILQEKLSWYMDTVEMHLISSISTASTSFFAALGSLRELHSEAADSVSGIRTLREDLARLNQDMAVGGLKIVAMRRRRENMQKLGDAVRQLHEVVETVTRCEKQVDNGEIEEALDGLREVEKLILGEYGVNRLNKDKSSSVLKERLVDLRGIKALEGADNDIAFLRRRIGRAFETRFIQALVEDLRRHVDSVPSNTTLQRWDKASHRFRGSHVRTPSAFPSYLHVNESLRSTLRSQLKGLARSDAVMPATAAYREAVLREIKSLIRRHLPSSNDDDNESTMSTSTQESRNMSQQEKSSILARNLRALEPEDAEDMLRKIYSNVSEAIRRLGTQVKVLLDVTSNLANPVASAALRSPPKSPQIGSIDGYFNATATPGTPLPIQQDEIQQALDLSNILGQAVDIAQTQITKILKVRSEQSTHLTLSKFLRYFTINRLFADECEAASGRSGAALKSVVNAHIKDFVIRFGDVEKQRLVQSMDADRWDAKDFTDVDSSILGRIVEGSTRDVDAWAKDYLVWEDEDVVSGALHTNGTMINGTSGAKEKIRSATIDEQKYILPESAMIVSGGVENFERLITGIPSMSQEITSSLLEYLKLFNSRSSQLILGAGATRSAGLKNITTKHLALSSQALSFVIALIPHIREFVRRHSSASGNLMTEFDKLKRLYQEHQSGIHDKLVDIMSGRASSHVAAMKHIDWDSSSDSGAVNGYMETLVKESTTLHKVLSKHLPELVVRMIMDPVFDSYKEQWGTAFADVEVKTPKGKERYVSSVNHAFMDSHSFVRLLRDVEFFRSRISKINGAGDIGDYLVHVVEQKYAAQDPQPTTAASDSGPETEQSARKHEAEKS